MSDWLKNLKKWQKGALIGCAVGLIIVCLIAYAWQDSGLVSYIIKLFALLLHYWLAWPFSWLWDHGYIGYVTSWALLCAILVIIYGWLGAIAGRIQQMSNHTLRWGLSGLLVLFLIVFMGQVFS